MVGMVFARSAGSWIPEPSNGYIYPIPLGRTHNLMYLEYWQYITYETLTILGMVLFGMSVITMVLYNLITKFRGRRSQ